MWRCVNTRTQGLFAVGLAGCCLCVCGVGGLPATAVGRAPIGQAARAPRAVLTSVCRPGQRRYSVTATMRSLRGTRQLQVRFELEAKPPGATAYEPLRTPGLDVWRSPTSSKRLGRHPGDVWNVTQPVAHLQRGVSYRFRVGFRWLGYDATVLRREHRLSRPCLIKAARYAWRQI